MGMPADSKEELCMARHLRALASDGQEDQDLNCPHATPLISLT